MKQSKMHIKEFVNYLFTPEDSGMPVRNGGFSYRLRHTYSLPGALKVLFWTGMACYASILVSMLQ